ncbi:SDR family oxidoreductase [Laribacter hongkongensis]|uniref:SDR family oxidoreductase n=1 Tax=Laribacter hongkongensis TaxID=168471 RepID=UPI001EFE1D91|nr:SDR family oxidoreductase [Laribacter hongkongensis]MCG9099085.1 SDR family oxidoreductase [Laribacter hongkongensis]
MKNAPILIWGAGAIGGTLAVYLARAGHAVRLVDTDPQHVAAIRAHGLRLTGPILEDTVPVDICTPDTLTGSYPLVLLATKAVHTRAACRQLLPFLSRDGAVVSVQNGLNEQVIADIAGAGRTIGCFVNFGADIVAPGVIHFGGWGATVVGELDGSETPRIRALHGLMCEFNPNAVLTPNIWGYLWGKLVYGSMLFATALTNEGIYPLLENPVYRPVLAALAREVCTVASAAGLRLEGFDGFDPAAFMPDAPAEAGMASLEQLAAHNRKSAKFHAGIWRDLAIHHRKTEVDEIIAPIAATGRQHGVPTPLTDALIEAMHVAEGGVPQGLGLLDRVRAALAPAPVPGFCFDGQTVLVTGAAQGIGREIVRQFAVAGARVIAADIGSLDDTVAACDGCCETLALDVSDPVSVHDQLAGLGRIDVLVNCAGGVCGQAGRPLEEIKPDEWRAIFAVNADGAFWCSQAVAPAMKARGAGRIIMISSGAGLGVSLTGIQAYAAAKAAQIGLTRQLAHELGPWGITVNSIAPGFVRSNPSTERQWQAYGTDGQQRLLDNIALRRLGTPQDIAHAVLFFASPFAGWISGQTLAVDGGK